MSDKGCPKIIAAALINISVEINTDCIKEECGYYDEHAQQCSQVSQARALRDIAEQLKRNADAMLDYSPAKEPVEVELKALRPENKMFCKDCKYDKLGLHQKPCCSCGIYNSNWQPK